MHMVVIRDYYQMTIMDEKHQFDETSTFIAKFFSKPYSPPSYICLYI